MKSSSSGGLRKGSWTKEEDDLLKTCIQKHGEGQWYLVPQRAGLKRCRKSCRLRWLNYLKPEINRGDFTEDEVDMILRFHRLLGNRWSLIAGRLPGRTANDVKNYWFTKLRGKEETSDSKKKDKKKEEAKDMSSGGHESNDHVILIKPKPRRFSKNSAWPRQRTMFAEKASTVQPELVNVFSAKEDSTVQLLGNGENVREYGAPAQPYVTITNVSQSEIWTRLQEGMDNSTELKEERDSSEQQELNSTLMLPWNQKFIGAPDLEDHISSDFSSQISLWDFPFM